MSRSLYIESGFLESSSISSSVSSSSTLFTASKIFLADFNLAANSWQLHFLRLTNQLSDNIEVAKLVFEQMNIEHSAVMRRFSAQGGIKNWDTSAPSVWLTAWALRTFSWICYQDWEDYIYIDPKVRCKIQILHNFLHNTYLLQSFR